MVNKKTNYVTIKKLIVKISIFIFIFLFCIVIGIFLYFDKHKRSIEEFSTTLLTFSGNNYIILFFDNSNYSNKAFYIDSANYFIINKYSNDMDSLEKYAKKIFDIQAENLEYQKINDLLMIRVTTGLMKWHNRTNFRTKNIKNIRIEYIEKD